MPTIDDKVVAMSFEHSKFESGVHKTISALDKLKASLKFPDAGKGLNDINAASKRVDLGHIAKGVDGIRAKLGFLSVAALAVFAQIAQRALAAGASFVKAFTIDPVVAGLREYETNLNAVQTILANTQAAGTGLKDVNKALQELNEYSDKTIYNFAQMARNIGTFTAAGVELDTATGAIKGIANLAALSGSNAEQASTAMYQLSQAISAGRVTLMDWNSVVNAGMGGTVFQRALAQTAVAMGTLEEKSLKLVGPMKNVSIAGQSFRASLAAAPGKESWLTSKVLTSTLEQFTSDLSDAELAAMGFNAAQIKSIQQTAKTAMHAATQVKTVSGVIDTAKETAISGWAQTWQIIFGDFAEAKTLFTGISTAINGFISASADARNKVLGDWKALGGRTALIEALKNTFQALGAILAPIRDGFRDIFPAMTGKRLADLTKQFRDFTKTLMPSPETVDNLRRTFRGLFAILSIGKQIISGVFSVFGRLIGVFDGAGSSFLDITGKIGNFFWELDKALKKGDQLGQFFDSLGDTLAAPLEILVRFGDALRNLLSGFSSGGFSGQMDAITDSMGPFQRALEGLIDIWDKFSERIADADIMAGVFESIAQAIQGLGPAINSAISSMNFEAILQVIRTGLFAALVLMFKNFFGRGSALEQVSKGFGGGIIANISGSFGALRGSMVAMQNNIKAKTLKEIAIAIALLTASVVALTLVDPDKVSGAMAAMTLMFGQLVGAMMILDKLTKGAGFIKLPFIAASLIMLAGAINLLTISVIAMSLLSWEQLIKGLSGIAVLLGGITLAAGPLSANSAGMIRAGAGITAMAIGLNILAIAVGQFARMSMGELAKGMGGIAAGLIIIAGAMKVMPKSMVITGAGLIVVATGLRILANVVRAFGALNWSTIGKGMTGVAGSLIVIAGAMRLMPTNLAITATGLLLVSLALGRIASAVESMGGMSLEQIAKGLGTLAGSLVILAAGLTLMQGSIGGAVALGVAAGGLALLAPVLIVLGKQSWVTIIKGMISLAAALALLGGASMALAPAVPAMLGFGAALVVIGAGLALAGAGIALIGIGLSAIAVSGTASVAVLIQALTDFQEALIENAKLMVEGLLEIVRAFAATAPQFVDAMVKIIGSMLDALIKLSPKIAEALNTLIPMMLGVLRQNQGQIIQAGFDFLIAFLQGIRNNLAALVKLAADIVVQFLNNLARHTGRIISAGANVLIAFVKGIANNLARIAAAAISIITKFLGAIASNLAKVARAGLSIITKLMTAISSKIGEIIQLGTTVIVKFVQGVGSAGAKIVAAATNAIIKFINAISKNAVKLADAGATAIINFLNGIAKVIEQREPEMIAAGARIGVAIVKGFVQALRNGVGQVGEAARALVNSAKNKLKFWDSPPETFGANLGKAIVSGLADGLKDNSEAIFAAQTVSRSIIDAFNTVFQTASPSKVMAEIGRFVGQGFAQGLRGSAADINSAYAELHRMLNEAMATARETIATEEDKLRELRKAKKPDAEAIRAAQRTIAENEALLARATAGHRVLTKALRDEKAELVKLANDFEKVTAKLEAAQQVLDDAIRTRDEAKKGFTEQFGGLPDISSFMVDAEGKPVDPATAVANYQAALSAQINAIAAYRNTLNQLRAMGLDDATYQQLLEEGVGGQAFADALLAGGQTAINSVNQLDTQIAAESSALATTAANNLYQAGVDAAQGVVNGLKAKQSEIRKAMEEIATEMIRAIKKKLKMKSPSEVFAEVGKQSMKGMAQGFSDSSNIVKKSINNAAEDALIAMRKSMRSISDTVTDELNPDPTITPILDLTRVREQAQELSALTNVTPITAAASYGAASAISASELDRFEAEKVAAAMGTAVKFEQNNYSPEALNEVEIYRRTKNQISQIKSVLANT